MHQLAVKGGALGTFTAQAQVCKLRAHAGERASLMGQAECGLPSLVVEIPLSAYYFIRIFTVFSLFSVHLLIASCLIFVLLNYHANYVEN